MKMNKTIDITPTWAGIVPALLEAYASASPMKREDIRDEFLKMAKAVDAYTLWTRQRRPNWQILNSINTAIKNEIAGAPRQD